MDIGGLFKSACGAVAKVAKAVVKTVVGVAATVAKAVINIGKPVASALFNAAVGALDAAVSSTNEALVELGVDEEELEDEEELLQEQFKLLVGALIMGWDNLKNSDAATDAIKSLGISQWGIKQTQDKTFPGFFDTFGFDIDDNGVYHSQQDGWQQYLGYTDLYDEAFDLACSMDKQKFDFEVNNKKYIIWLWKGDYLNLGAGAETGIYYDDGKSPIWECDIKDSMPMTLRLEDKQGNVIYDWKPSKDNWWCTGFNPKYQNKKVEDLTSIGTIDFSEHLDMWISFYEKYNGWEPWEFDCENHIAKYTWEGKKNI